MREDAKVRICIYDSTGKLVIQLLNESKEQGTHEVTWQGRNTKGGIVSTGLYVGSIEAGDDRVEVMVTLIDSTDKAGVTMNISEVLNSQILKESDTEMPTKGDIELVRTIDIL